MSGIRVRTVDEVRQLGFADESVEGNGDRHFGGLVGEGDGDAGLVEGAGPHGDDVGDVLGGEEAAILQETSFTRVEVRELACQTGFLLRFDSEHRVRRTQFLEVVGLGGDDEADSARGEDSADLPRIAGRENDQGDVDALIGQGDGFPQVRSGH